MFLAYRRACIVAWPEGSRVLIVWAKYGWTDINSLDLEMGPARPCNPDPALHGAPRDSISLAC